MAKRCSADRGSKDRAPLLRLRFLLRPPKGTSHETGRRGFSLVELLISIAVMATLATLAYPSLSGYLLKNKRVAAQQNLYNLQLQQETWRISHAHYAMDIEDLQPNLVAHPHYVFSIAAASSSQYQLTATAKADSAQHQDRQGTQSCQRLTLSRHHEKTPLECWE